MKKIILICLMFFVSQIQAETLEEYKKSVGKDIVLFEKTYGQFFDNDTYQAFSNANREILIRSIFIDNMQEMDLLVLYYLDYKLIIQKKLEKRLFLQNIINILNKKKKGELKNRK